MIFIDTNVFMFAVGREHPLKAKARSFFQESIANESVLATSAEVLQELLHAYLPVDRLGTLDLALDLVRRSVATVWTVESADVLLARDLAETHRGLGARDLLHLACCVRRDVTEVQSFDRALSAAFASRGT